MGNFFRRKITLFPRHFCFTFYHFHHKIPLAVSNSNSKVTLLKGFVLNLRPDETPRLKNAQKAIYPPVYEAPLLCISFGYTRAHTCPKTSPLYVTCESIVVGSRRHRTAAFSCSRIWPWKIYNSSSVILTFFKNSAWCTINEGLGWFQNNCTTTSDPMMPYKGLNIDYGFWSAQLINLDKNLALWNLPTQNWNRNK